MVSPKCILAAILALPVASGLAFAAVPLPSGEVWDGGGLGGTLSAGPTWSSDEGFTPNHLGSQVWYHYKENLVGSMGIEMSDWVSSRTKSLFTTQYVGALSWIPLSTSRQILDVALRVGGERISTTLDTTSHALPLTDNSWEWQVGARVGGGWSRDHWGAWASTGPIASWRTSGAASGWSMAQESELGVLLSLQSFWNGARGYTRAWNLVVRTPLVYQPKAPTFTRDGVVHTSKWSMGIQVGPSVLF
jgi:hypothetical protein